MNSNNSIFVSGSNPDDMLGLINQCNQQENIIENLSAENAYLKGMCTQQSTQISAEKQKSEAMNAALSAQNRHLTMELAKEKTKKKKNPRRFINESDGFIKSIEPNGTDKTITYMKMIEAELIDTIVDGKTQSLIRLRFLYSCNQSAEAIIPIDKIGSGNLLQYFPYNKINEKSLINDALRTIIQTFLSDPNTKHKYYPEFPGIHLYYIDNRLNSAEFICSDGNISEQLRPYLSSTYQKKILPHTKRSAGSIEKDIRPYFVNIQSYVLLAFSLTGILSSLLESINYPFCLHLTVSTPDPDTETLTVCYMKTYEHNKQPRQLTMTRSDLIELLKSGNDEIIVLKDNLTGNDSYRLTTAIDTIQTFETDDRKKPYVLAILTHNIQYYFPPGKAIHIEINDFNGIDSSPDSCAEICRCFDEMIRFFADEFCKHVVDYATILRTHIKSIREQNLNLNMENSKTSFAVLYTVLLLWHDIFHIELPQNIYSYLLKLVQDSENSATGNSAAIVNAFFRELNTAISDGKLEATELGRNMHYCQNENKVYLSGNMMLIEEKTFRNLLLPKITVASTVQSVLNALKSQGYLEVNSGENRKSFTVYYDDPNLSPEQRDFITFHYREMLRSDVIEHLKCRKDKHYFTNDRTRANFIPLIENSMSSIAGQIQIPNHNYHRFVSGKSGSGKTVFLTQLLYYLQKIGNRIVVFDSNNSFERDAICENLPKKFIDAHFTFHNIEEKGIPVNPFYLYESDNLPKRKRTIVSALTATLHELSEPQVTAIQKMTRNLLINASQEQYTFLDIMAYFSRTVGTSEKSIVKRLEGVFYDMVDSCEDLSEDDWFTFLNSSKEVVVISTGNLIGICGNQLIDMLLSSLLIAQQRNLDFRQLSIFIDEIQNQNLTKNGAIYSILHEGRKYHIDLNFATQYVTSANENKLLRQAGLSVYFQPDESSRVTVMDMLGLKKKEQYLLDELTTGTCIIKGNIFNHEKQICEEAMLCGKTVLVPDSPLRKNMNL